jgi:hypothetical protein
VPHLRTIHLQASNALTFHSTPFIDQLPGFGMEAGLCRLSMQQNEQGEGKDLVDALINLYEPLAQHSCRPRVTLQLGHECIWHASR